MQMKVSTQKRPHLSQIAHETQGHCFHWPAPQLGCIFNKSRFAWPVSLACFIAWSFHWPVILFWANKKNWGPSC